MGNLTLLKTPETTTKATPMPTKPEYSERELELFKELRDVISELSDQEDKSWLDQEHDYEYVLEKNEIIANFVENYSSKSIGCTKFDDLSAEDIAARVPADVLTQAILTHSEFEPCDYYIQWNEMGSVGIGEYEYQIDVADASPDLHKCLAQMTDAELTKFHAWTGYLRVSRDSFCIYGNPCERLVFKLDPEAFLQDKTILKALRAKVKAPAAKLKAVGE